MRIVSLATMTVLLAAYAATAQIAYVLPNSGLGATHGICLPTSGFPAGAPDPRGPLPLAAFLGSGTPFNALPAGGHAIDQVTATVYSSDGVILQAEGHTLYVPAGGAPGLPIGLFPGGGPITGLAVNGAPGGFLYICNPTAFQPRAKAFPFAPAGPPVVPAFPHPPFSGMGFDPATGTIWLCDIAGAIYHVTLAGAAIGPQPVALTAGSGLPFVGLDVNTSNGAGFFPEPPCSTALPGYHICVTDGFAIYDALSAANPPILLPTTFPGPSAYGLAFSSDSQDLGGAGVCNSTGNFLVNGLNRPSVVGAIPGPATSLTCSGAIPFGTLTLWVDLCPVLGGIPVPGAGTLFINPFAPPISGGAVANVSGVASIAMPLSFAPANVTFACQWFAVDPLNAPTFICLSNAMVVTSGLR